MSEAINSSSNAHPDKEENDAMNIVVHWLLEQDNYSVYCDVSNAMDIAHSTFIEGIVERLRKAGHTQHTPEEIKSRISALKKTFTETKQMLLDENIDPINHNQPEKDRVIEKCKYYYELYPIFSKDSLNRKENNCSAATHNIINDKKSSEETRKNGIPNSTVFRVLQPKASTSNSEKKKPSLSFILPKKGKHNILEKAPPSKPLFTFQPILTNAPIAPKHPPKNSQPSPGPSTTSTPPSSSAPQNKSNKTTKQSDQPPKSRPRKRNSSAVNSAPSQPLNSERDIETITISSDTSPPPNNSAPPPSIPRALEVPRVYNRKKTESPEPVNENSSKKAKLRDRQFEVIKQKFEIVKCLKDADESSLYWRLLINLLQELNEYSDLIEEDE